MNALAPARDDAPRVDRARLRTPPPEWSSAARAARLGAGKRSSSAAVPTVKPAAPASRTIWMRAVVSMEPAMITGTSACRQTSAISIGTSTLAR